MGATSDRRARHAGRVVIALAALVLTVAAASAGASPATAAPAEGPSLGDASLVLGQVNLTAQRGTSGERLHVTSDDCVAFTASHPDAPADSTLVLTYPPDVYETVAAAVTPDPGTSPESADADGGESCALPAVATAGVGVVRVPVSEARTTVPLRVRSAADGTPPVVAAEVRRDGVAVTPADEVRQRVWTATVAQTVGDVDVASVARVPPGDEVELTVRTGTADGGPVPDGAVVELVYPAPLVPTEGTADDERVVRRGWAEQVTVGFAVPEDVPDALRGVPLATQVRLRVGQDVVATTTAVHVVPATLTVEHELIGDGQEDVDGAIIPTITVGSPLEVVATVVNSDDVRRADVQLTTTYDGAVFAVPADLPADTSCEPSSDDTGSRIICTSLLGTVAPGAPRSVEYAMPVRADLTGGVVDTVVSDAVAVGEDRPRSLVPQPVRILAPDLVVEIRAAEAVEAGRGDRVVVTVSNDGPSAARGSRLELAPAAGGDLVQTVVPPADFAVEGDGDIDLSERPFVDGQVLVGTIPPIPPGDRADVVLDVTYAQVADADAQVQWTARLAPYELTATAATGLLPSTMGGDSGPIDRLEDDKYGVIVFTVVAPLLLLLLLVLLGRWVGAGVEPVLQRVVDGVLVVFLVSAVLVMHLAGGLEAESAAAIVGSIAGYVFGRATERLSSDEDRRDDKAAAGPPSDGGTSGHPPTPARPDAAVPAPTSAPAAAPAVPRSPASRAHDTVTATDEMAGTGRPTPTVDGTTDDVARTDDVTTADDTTRAGDVPRTDEHTGADDTPE